MSSGEVNVSIDARDDPIGAKKHANWLRKQAESKAEEIDKAQTILGKRKFGAMSASGEGGATMQMDAAAQRRMKRRILDVGESAKVLKGTQLIEESAFGQGAKSVMRLSVENEESGEVVTPGSLKEKMLAEPVFEMVAFPKHDGKRASVSEVNTKLQQKVG